MAKNWDDRYEETVKAMAALLVEKHGQNANDDDNLALVYDDIQVAVADLLPE